MRIVRLELHGFKSFADRTVFSFGQGISCVVGPNGCGKSNVVDALRWCIGEQSARSLRGGEMMDVIFAGSADRKPVSYAEVAITFTAEGGEPFPGEFARYTEVQVARRLYRSGASEYLMNQTRCRRKDIVDLLMDSGVGNNLYSFIEQGRIDKIVSASPEDRRSLIDEAAGITRYKMRRAEAQSKLESTASQLDRAADVVDEMERRLRTLERQVIKAARFRRLRALVRQQEILLHLARHQDASVRREALAVELKRLREGLDRAEVQSAGLRDDLELRAGEVEVAEDAVGAARDALHDVDARRRELLATAGLHEQRLKELRGQRERALSDAAEEQERLTAAQEEAKAAQAELDAVAHTWDDAQQAVTRASQALVAAEAGQDAARREVEAASSLAEDAGRARAELEARLGALQSRLDELPERQRRAASRLDEATQERSALGRRIAVAEQARDEAVERIARLDDALAAQQTEVEAQIRKELHARDAVQRAEQDQDAARDALDAAVAGLDAARAAAEARVGRALAELRRTEEANLRDADKEAERAVANADADAQRALQDAEVRARSWLEVDRSVRDEAIATWRQDWQRERDAEEARRQGALDAAQQAAATAVEDAEARVRGEAEPKVNQARAKREAEEQGLAQAQQQLADLDALLGPATRKLRDAEGQVAALEAEERASRSRDAGAEAVSEALGGLRSLAEHLAAQQVDVADAGRLLGARLLLPVIGAAALDEAAATAKASGAASLLVFDGDPSVDALLANVARVPTLDAALAHHQSTGGAAVVESTGERVDVDGVVHIGQSDDSGAAALDRQGKLAAAREAVTVGVEEVTRLQGNRTQARARVEAGQIRLRKAIADVDSSEKQLREQVRDAVRRAREDAERAVQIARQAWSTWRAETRKESERQLADRTRARDAAVATLRKEADVVLEQLRRDLARSQSERRGGLQAERDARRAEMEARLDEAAAAARQDAESGLSGHIEARGAAAVAVERSASSVNKARAQAEAAAKDLDAARKTLDAHTRERAEADLLRVRLDGEARSAAEQRERLVERIRALEDEQATLAEALRDAQELLKASADRLSGRRDEDAAAREALRLARDAARRADEQVNEARRRRDEAERQLSSLRERRARAEAQGEASRNQAASSAERLASAQHRAGELDAVVTEADAQRAAAARQADALSDARQDAAEALDAATQHFHTVRSRRDDVQQQLRDLDASAQQLHRDLLSAEQTDQQLATDLASGEARIEERYQHSLTKLLAHLRERSGLRLEAGDEARAGLEVAGKRVEPVSDMVLQPEMLTDEALLKDVVAELGESREQLARIGEVNLTALDEYTELKERYTDLESQRADLDASVQSIRSAIAKMNRTCRERFRETFDRVTATFAEAYPDLVGGGEAKLLLTNEDDLLETGVEILVRPPGKRLQNLTLLSGGEKAMTAIALLLALFTVKPSPFCVLDEVDAPLDEANGARFNDMIRQMSSMTQFIVITHNRKTMECADVLYGITMPTPGCSKVVSVQVD